MLKALSPYPYSDLIIETKTQNTLPSLYLSEKITPKSIYFLSEKQKLISMLEFWGFGFALFRPTDPDLIFKIVELRTDISLRQRPSTKLLSIERQITGRFC